MEEPRKKKIRVGLPLKVNNYKKNYKKRYNKKHKKQGYGKDRLDREVHLSYDALRIIFLHLNGKDLSSAAMVSRSWSVAADDAKCLRPKCFALHCIYFTLHKLKLIEDKNYSSFLYTIYWIKPSIGFFFLSYACMPDNITDDICKSLPKNCKAIMLLTNAISINNYRTKYPPQSKESPDTICALLPEIPDVKISVIEITEIILEGYGLTKYEEMIEASIQDYENKPSCLLLFCNHDGLTTASQMARIAQLRYHEKIDSFWGGVVDGIKTNEECFDTQALCVAILITGSIQTWSVVMDSMECKTEEQVEETLKLFKEQVKLQEYSVGFIFSSEIHEKGNMESTIFRRLFPEVFLVGCSGIGEFGRNTTVDKTEPVREILWNHEFSTTFMILTYNRKKISYDEL